MCQLFAGIPAHDIEGETRSVRLGGHSTSIRLEAAFWRTLESLSESQGMTLGKFLTKLHDEVLDLNGEVRNFASHLRCACLVHLQREDSATTLRAPRDADRFRRRESGQPVQMPIAS
ncbi:ribbon-helix-helix domain-containing protein [Fulvimarina sp. 2208YS6-2-32]|uniref:Ribbon-helix-helix domain-containing protein n=1 Tax=Fulvimarina uroteuthidis TaxID=3098149 RepID=A0ABU5HXG0_9HYPH|nr:ribbon-helix-helix domain-containing protein [Fulvimarina sp. 2208YS6-2-32]MDY8107824.1 ribbon-helix-helix domain-containing protein [Fulvimarina sp. 2208YS6-2-32]